MASGGECDVAWVQNPAVNVWVEIVAGSLLCSNRFFTGYSSFPLSSKTSLQIQPFLAARDVSRNKCPPQQQKFHTNDIKSVRNLVRKSDWSP